MFVRGSAIGLSWEKSLEQIAKVEFSGKADGIFTPLSADQLKLLKLLLRCAVVRVCVAFQPRITTIFPWMTMLWYVM